MNEFIWWNILQIEHLVEKKKLPQLLPREILKKKTTKNPSPQNQNPVDQLSAAHQKKFWYYFLVIHHSKCVTAFYCSSDSLEK